MKNKYSVLLLALVLCIVVGIVGFAWPPAPIQALPGIFADGFQGINAKLGTVEGMQLQSDQFIGQGVGTVIASASTIAPLKGITHISGAAAVATITLPVLDNGSAFTGCVVLIPDGAFTTTTGGNISLASTAVVNKALTECYDGTKWNPSY